VVRRHTARQRRTANGIGLVENLDLGRMVSSQRFDRIIRQARKHVIPSVAAVDKDRVRQPPTFRTYLVNCAPEPARRENALPTEMIRRWMFRRLSIQRRVALAFKLSLVIGENA
jgi:hypothetical protein